MTSVSRHFRCPYCNEHVILKEINGNLDIQQSRHERECMEKNNLERFSRANSSKSKRAGKKTAKLHTRIMRNLSQ